MKMKENRCDESQGKDEQRLKWSAAYLNVFLTFLMPSSNFEEKTEEPFKVQTDSHRR